MLTKIPQTMQTVVYRGVNDLRVETKDHPFLTTPPSKLGGYSQWIKGRQTGATQSITPEDLTEVISILDADQPKYLQP